MNDITFMYSIQSLNRENLHIIKAHATHRGETYLE